MDEKREALEGEDKKSRSIAQRILGTFAEFDKLESSGSIVLVACALIAIILANTPFSAAFLAYWERPLVIGFELSLRQWINDGLMAFFFFLVGLEIKREILVGELATWRRALLPILAAVGGMAVPALIYFCLNPSGIESRGWGVAMATDIAFSLGVLALLGSRVPIGIKVFLAALAIADDLGAVIVIALFYTPQVHWGMLAGAVAAIAVVYFAARKGWDHPLLFILAAPLVWTLTHESGIHATLAGVALAFTVPAKRRVEGVDGRQLEMSLIETMIHKLLPWVTYLFVPLFALANAGVRFVPESIGGSITWGVLAGLTLGKPVGIVAMTWVGVRTGIAQLPRSVSWTHIVGAGVLAGIGFTMSLFIAELAFGKGEHLDASKAGIFAASLLSAVGGYALMRSASRRAVQTGVAAAA